MLLQRIINKLVARRPRRAGEVEWLHANVPRTREHPLRARWILAGVGVLLLITVASVFYYVHFSHNDQFLLTDLRVVSGETVTEGLVRELILQKQPRTVREGREPCHLFGPDIEQVRDILLQNPVVRDIRITRRLPSRLEVRIVEREPVGRVGHNDQVIDGEGVVFPRSVGVDHLPLVVGLDGIPVRPGAHLDGMGLAAVRLLAVITRPEFVLPVAVVDVSHPDYLDLTLKDQRHVKLWWRGMDAATGNDSRDALGKRLKRLLQAMAMAPQRQLWDATVPDDNRIFTPY
jgi:hypothetical protein